jgi:DNA-binding transcriptional LysR family regulator
MAFNLSRFDLITLRLFVAAVEHGSLTAGAERLGISLAAASKRIAELEAHVGVPLLARSKRGVVPSDAGATLLPHATEMVARLAQLALAMSELQGGTAGQLRLWANTSAFGGFLPALLAAYVRQYPQVRLDLEDVISEDAVRGVQRGAVELGIVGDNVACRPCPATPTSSWCCCRPATRWRRAGAMRRCRWPNCWRMTSWPSHAPPRSRGSWSRPPRPCTCR